MSVYIFMTPDPVVVYLKLPCIESNIITLTVRGSESLVLDSKQKVWFLHSKQKVWFLDSKTEKKCKGNRLVSDLG